MRILAIDPGYERLGVAIVEKLPRNTPPAADGSAPLARGDMGRRETLLYSACIQTSKTLFHEKRLLAIADAVAKLIAEWKPEALAIETLFLATNHKTAMAVAEARGAVLVEAARAGLVVYEYSPLQVKMAITGYGKSDKRQVAEMVKKLIAVPDKTTHLPKTAVLPLLRENTTLPPTFPKKWGVLPLIRERKSLPLEDSGTPPAPEQVRYGACFKKGRIRLDDEYDAIAIGLTCLASNKWDMEHGT